MGIFSNKKGMELKEFITWVIAVLVLSLIASFIYSLSSGRLPALLQKVFSVLRFGA
jgi:hypothetical protein